MRKIAVVLLLASFGFVLALALSNPAAAIPDSIPNKECLACHTEPGEVGEAYVVDEEHFETGPHIEDNGVTCAGCHSGAAEVEDIYDHGRLGSASCDSCHEHDDIIAAVESVDNAHSRSRRGGELPTCVTCHGAHEILYGDDPSSPANRRNQPGSCGACHSGEMLDDFMRSIHGRRLEAGSPDGPACSTCHDPHKTLIADIVRNPVFKVELIGTCGSCHPEALEEYWPSDHGAAVQNGVFESASCADCHSSHRVMPPASPASTVYPTHVVENCGTCHSDARLIRRFDLPQQVVGTYGVSYHGRAVGLGDTRVANCSSCHDNHAIYKAGDPRSSIHPSNLQKTCGVCHPGANENFITGKIHVYLESGENFWAWLVANVYTWIIVIVIGAMVVHNLLDFVRKLMVRNRQQKSEPHVIRMTLLERVMHATMAIGFILLAYTGFALIFPNAWWVAPLNWISHTEEFRSSLHRVCGVVITLTVVHHLWYLFFHRRGREQRRHFMPRLKDLRDFKDNILFYLGRRPERPRFGRFTYMEKAEYWALVWGTAVMVITGFVLWFENLAAIFMPRWLWEVFAVVHLYEAILAVLAIIVWHFYYIFINPDEAPMSLTWFSGGMTYKELAKTHPEEFEQVRRAEMEELEKKDG